MGEFSNTVVKLLRREAQDQIVLSSSKGSATINMADPLRLWIVQLGVIVGTASLLSLGLRKIRQPKVIAEVLGGILLGPTAFGRIPGFTDHIFPSASIPFLSLTANLGLCLFLFLVGLEIDMALIKRNVKLSGTVATAGVVVPFAAGAALSTALYKEFINTPTSGLPGFVKFTHFMLFAGVAFSITAFPILCRIMIELKLLDTTVGVVVLSAGVANDIIGWVLLALAVALANASSGLTALYILLICMAWTIFLLTLGQSALLWLGRKTGSVGGHGPTMLFMTVTMLFLFASAFFTDVIGVHAIFGAFLVGIIVPREGNLAIHLTEKLEDVASIIFLPLYFTLSGLSTDLGLLNTGKIWAYTLAIIALAFTGKFGGCYVASRYIAGFSVRESGAIGALMSCKGLIELIVLNVGLKAGILNQRALVLTFMTTPLAAFFYPPEIRARAAATGPNFHKIMDETGPSSPLEADPENVYTPSTGSSENEEAVKLKTRLTIVIDHIEHLPGMMALTQMVKPSLLSPISPPATLTAGSATPHSSRTPASLSSMDHSISALRLVELSDRTSAVMQSVSIAAHPDHATRLIQCDPLLNIFTMFATMNNLNVVPALEIVRHEDLARCVVDFAQKADQTARLSGNRGGEMLLLPWLPPTVGHGQEIDPSNPAAVATHNPFDALFSNESGETEVPTSVPGSFHTAGDMLSSATATAVHAKFVTNVFSKATVDVGLFMDLGCEHVTVASQGFMKPSVSSWTGVEHILLPFFGGPDDRLALAFVAQLCENENIAATCLRLSKTEDSAVNGPTSPSEDHVDAGNGKNPISPETLLTVASTVSASSRDTTYGHTDLATHMQSETADHLAWAQYTGSSPSTSSGTPSTSGFPSKAALSRMQFQDLASPMPLYGAIAEATRLRSSSVSGKTNLLVVSGRSRRFAVDDHMKEIKKLMEEHHAHGLGREVQRTIGDVAYAMVMAGCAQQVLVVQTASNN